MGLGMFCLGRGGFGAVLLQREQRHHKARRAETALRTVAVDHRLLHAVQAALMLEVFDADQLLAVQRGHEGQARVEAAITQLLPARRVGAQLADDHGTCAAIAAGAAFFGAGFMQVLAQIVEDRHIGVQSLFGFQLLVQEKLDHGSRLVLVVKKHWS